MDDVRVLIADDHPMFRKGLRTLLASMPQISVVGEATSGEEAIELTRRLEPDVLLLDLQMPAGGGLHAIRELTTEMANTRILVVTLFDDDESIFSALKAGARGYVLKDASEDEMVRAIEAAAQGEAIFSPAIAARLVDFFSATPPVQQSVVFPELTEREREVLVLIARGRSNAEIADELSISLKTVRNHASNIFNKLHVVDRLQAALRARKAGLR
jgi:DNA-binding NarL/FixJ family response regulator